MTELEHSYQRKPDRKVYIFGFVLVFIGLVNLLMIVFKPAINKLFILFLYSIPSNAVISLFPHEPVIIFYGKLYNPLLTSLLAGIATCVAGFLDYQVFTPLLNLRAFNPLKQNVIYRTSIKYFSKIPFLVIVIAGFSPIPFVPIKILSFSSRYPLHRYIEALFIGRVPRYYILALMGKGLDIPNWMLILLFLAIFGYLIGRKGYDVLKKKTRRGQISRSLDLKQVVKGSPF